MACARVSQESEINRLRTKTFELKRDLPDIESLCRELETSAAHLATAKAQAKRQHEEAAHLRGEKADLESEVAELKRTVAEVEGAHAAQIEEQVLRMHARILLC